jgi:hypothetical protein
MEKIKSTKFVYNPKDPRSTFLSLVTKTYPHGHEDEVLKFLPSLKKDIVGNYYHIIGSNPTTMFTSHLDTADHRQNNINLYSYIENGQEMIVTDGDSILGADDKAGVTIMLYMMTNNVPGLYYFFIGEERGGIGSGDLSDNFDKVDYLKDIKRCISFDRRDCFSIITSQMGGRCCSDEFANALCSEYNRLGFDMKPDNTGIFTDSAFFIDLIPECTNISVGYYHEHTHNEKQNMTHLIKLCSASVSVDWDSLPPIDKLEERIKKFKNFI